LLKRISRRISRSLADAVARENAARRPPPLAIVHAGAVVLPEGTIDNLSGTPESITIGEKSHVRGRLFVYPNGGSISIGSWCYVGARSEIWSMASVAIGDRVLISHDVNIIDNSGHSKNAVERHEHFRRIIGTGHPREWGQLPGVQALPIVIEEDVWINCGVIILQGVRIGARSVIGAGAIVTKDVAADTFYRNEIIPVMTALSQESR
jgi:maltose O-acetyltransferase